MAAFSPLLDMLAEVPDPRRAEGKLYQLPHVLLFSILAIVTGCNSYRGIVTFIEVHRRKLNTAFGLKWRRAPAHTAIRYILQGLDPTAVETVFRRHACAAQADIALIVQVKDNQPTLHQCSHGSPPPRPRSGLPTAATKAETATNVAPSPSSIPPKGWPTPTGIPTWPPSSASSATSSPETPQPGC